ncbi:MAG: TonB-dependent receptor, partial [Alphaproteobacteria bacterium]|nr:TonB-dependent receptor [Alphaproteobacteria bacterium]
LQRIADAPGFIIPPGLSPLLPQGLPLNQILQQQIPDIAPQNVSETFEEVSPGGGLFYRASDTVNIYARVNTGFRAGGFNSVPLTTATLAYDEEKSINYELGIKTEWLNRRVRFNVALFLLEQDDLLLFIRDPNDVRFGVLDNLGKAETYGIEIDATAKLTENWDFMGAFSWMDAKCKQCNNGIVDASGNQIPGTSDVTLSIVTTYRMQVANGLQLALNASFRQRWGGYEDAANTIDLEDYSMLDLGIWLESEQGWYVNIYADNLFDEEYNITRVTTEGLLRLPAAQSMDRHEAFGFSYGAKVGYRF